MSNLVYCGGGKSTNKPDWFKVTINPAKFGEHVKLKDDKNMLFLKILCFDDKDDYGKDVKVVINEEEDNYAIKGDKLCGFGKEVEDKLKTFKIAIETDRIKPHVQEYKGHKYIKLNLNVDDSGVRVSVDTWSPEPKAEPKAVTPEETKAVFDKPAF